MVDFTHNQINGNRDVNINIHEQQSIGKPFNQCTNDELFDERKFRKSEKRKRAFELYRASLKWFILLAIGLLIVGVTIWKIWIGMGQQLNFSYIFNLSFNLINLESSSFSSMLNAIMIGLIPVLTILLPLKLIFQNIVGDDEIMSRHRKSLWDIKMILKERGIKG